MEIHETIVNIFTFVREHYKFPLKLNTENGVVVFDHQYELFKYLWSPESMQNASVQHSLDRDFNTRSFNGSNTSYSLSKSLTTVGIGILILLLLLT
jgi:uncharacterized membrane protein YkgB